MNEIENKEINQRMAEALLIFIKHIDYDGTLRPFDHYDKTVLQEYIVPVLEKLFN